MCLDEAELFFLVLFFICYLSHGSFSFVVELEALKGRERLAGYDVVSLLKY